MNSLEKLEWMRARACSVDIQVNDHRGSYQSVAKWIENGYARRSDFVSPEVMAECIARDTLVEARCYPNTPVGFTMVAHYDIGAAIDALFELVKGSLEGREDWMTWKDSTT